MRINITIIFIAIYFCFSQSYAQIIQNGVIQEYNERAKKTPLGGVELNVRSAGSTVSDGNGNFKLQFLTLKPGEKVNVRRIEKLGYEIFNKEAVEQWNINPKEPFVIIMCSSERFKKIRDNYERVSSESYARQLKKEEAALAKLKADGKLQEVEYKKQLYELRENYEKQLDNLDNYVDRFSRIDLSELSIVEQKIIELVQQGKIDEAIAKYEEQNYVDKYTKEVAQIKEVSSAIDKLSDIKVSKEQSRDTLLAAINRQVETLKLAGGKENYERIHVILRDVAFSDTTNAECMIKYGIFLAEQNMLKDANSVLSSVIINPNLRVDEKIQALFALGSLQHEIFDIKSAFESFNEGLYLIAPNDTTVSMAELNYLIALGATYADIGDIAKSHEMYLKGKEKADIFAINSSDKEFYKIYSRIYTNLGNSYRNLGKVDDAIKAYKKSIEIENCLHNSHDLNNSSYQHLAYIYLDLGNIDDALKLQLKYAEILEELSQKQPLGYLRSLNNAYIDLSKTHLMMGNLNEAQEMSMKALKALNYLKSETGETDNWGYSQIYDMLALISKSKGEITECIEDFKKSLSHILNIKNTGIDDIKINLAISYANLATIYGEIEDWDNFNDNLSKANKELDEYNTPNIPNQILKANIYVNLGEIYRTVMNNYPESRKYYHKGLDIVLSAATAHSSYLKEAGNIYYNIAASYLFESDGDNAISHIDKALECDPENIHHMDGKGEVMMNLGRREDALKVWDDILRINPEIDPTTIYFHRLLFPDKYEQN